MTQDLQAVLEYNNTKIIYNTPNRRTVGRVKRIFKKEPLTIKWLDTIRAGETLIDVGANVGMYSMMAGVGRGATVYSLEPESQNYAVLNQNIASNECTNITAFNIGALDFNGYSVLNMTGHKGPGTAVHSVQEELDHVLKPKEVNFKQGLYVCSLDTFIDELKIKPKHIKIDVDGLEHRVIKGALNTISGKKIQSILIELNHNLREHRDVIETIQSKGFELVETDLRTTGDFIDCGEHLFIRK